MFESLESLLRKENMNRFLKDTFKGIPEDYCFSLMVSMMDAGIQDGVYGKEPFNELKIEDSSGKISQEMKEKIASCIKILYTFSYSLGQDIRERAKPELGMMKKGDFEYAYNYLAGILENIIGYFRPEIVEDFRENIKKHFQDIIESSSIDDEYISPDTNKRTIN